MGTFGERLKDAMTIRGVDAAQVALRRGVHPETIEHWLTLEKPDMAAIHLLDLSAFLNVRVRFLGLGTGSIIPLHTGEESTA